MTAQTQISGWLTPEDHARAASLIPGRSRVHQIAHEVAKASGVRFTDIVGDARNAEIVAARHLTWFIAHREGISLSAIARAVGCDHTTILHGVRREAARRKAAA